VSDTYTHSDLGKMSLGVVSGVHRLPRHPKMGVMHDPIVG